LVPGHPLPIKTSHLGKNAPKTSKTAYDIGLLQQKIDKLTAENKQLKLTAYKKTGASSQEEMPQDERRRYESKINELEREKSALEESLRGEMLVSEEQRNYIEILKEALESKIEELGITELLPKNEENKDPSEVFAKLAVMKKEIDDKKKELEKGESDVSEMEALIVDLKKQTDEQKQQLEEVHNNYAQALQDKNQLMKNIEDLNQKVFLLKTIKFRSKNYKKITMHF